MNVYRVSGFFTSGIFLQKFSRELLATSKEQALERVYSELGSNHNVRRNLIRIGEVSEIKPGEVTDPKVLAMLG